MESTGNVLGRLIKRADQYPLSDRSDLWIFPSDEYPTAINKRRAIMNDLSGKTAALPSLSVLFQADAISQQTTAVNEALTAQLASLTPPDDIVGLREAYSNGGLGPPASPMSAHAREIVIEGPAGPLSLRVLVPEQIRGVTCIFMAAGGCPVVTIPGMNSSNCSVR